MPALLPILSLVFCVALVATYTRSFREAVPIGGIVWALYLVAVTEALSAFTALRVPTVALAWSLFAGVTLVVLVRRRVVIPSLPPLASVTVAERVGIGVLAVASALLCFLALYGAPNSFDGMAYHLPRVVHWIQNESVRHYPTNVSRQDWMSPFAEFVMFHLHLLAGADWLDNLVQWLAMLGSLVVVSLVAKELGASRRGQLFAAILCATMPMGILAATSTKNDYVAAFWLLSAAYFLLVLLGADRRGETTRGYTMLFGASVGLALLTKGTSYIFVLPFLAWFAVEGLIHSPLRLLKRAAVAAAIAVLVNAPSYARNVETFGGPLGPPGQDGATTMLLFAPRAFVSNVTKTSVTEMGTAYGRINRHLEGGVRRVHSLIKTDIANPATTFAGHPYAIWKDTTQEYVATNIPQIIVFVVAAIAVAAGRTTLSREQASYAAALIAAFLLFCALVRWQPWISRLTLPLFILAAPLCAALLSSFVPERRLTFLSAVLIATAIPWFLFNFDKPLSGSDSIFTKSRERQFFTTLPGRYPGYSGATSYVRSLGCNDVGLRVGGSGWEYVMWEMLQKGTPGRVRISHYGVVNATRSLTAEPRGASAHPCAIIRTTPLWMTEIGSGFGGYRAGWADSTVQVYVPLNAAPAR